MEPRTKQRILMPTDAMESRQLDHNRYALAFYTLWTRLREKSYWNCVVCDDCRTL